MSSPAILHTKQGAHKVPTDIHQHTFAPCNSSCTFTDDSSVTDTVLPVTVLKFTFPHLPFKDQVVCVHAKGKELPKHDPFAFGLVWSGYLRSSTEVKETAKILSLYLPVTLTQKLETQ